MEEKHTEEGGNNMIKYTCEYPGCGFTGTDLETKEHLNLREDHDISQPIFIDNEMKLTDVFENEYVPAYYLFDREGKLRHFQAGGSSMKTLFKRVERILNEG